MKNYEEMVSDLLERRDQYVVEQRRKKKVWVRVGATACCVCLMGMAGVGLWKGGLFAGPSEAGDQPGFSLEDKDIRDGFVYALYDRGWTLDELLGDPATFRIVRAVPVGVETDSVVARRWVLRVLESNRGGTEDILLSQLKDEYLLTQGEEVVLILMQDGDTEYYSIPSGGYGLFRPNQETGAVSGRLMPSLLERAQISDSSDEASRLTTKEVYDLLVGLSK